MAVNLAGHRPVAAHEDERAALVRLARILVSSGDGDLRLVGADGEIVLPATALGLLREAVEALARDDVVAVVPFHKHLTTDQAAEVLNVTHEHLLRLLDGGAIPSTIMDGDRSVHFDHLMAYREREDEDRRAGIVKLIRLSEELGLYDDDPPAPPRLMRRELGDPSENSLD